MSLEQSVQVMAGISEQVAAWHARGIVHRQLGTDAIAIGTSSQEIAVQEPSPSPLLFGGTHWDLEKSPFGFASIAPVLVPRCLSDAQAVFATQRLRLDPTQLDLYQLGVLFVRLLTGEGATSYLSSPRTKSRVPIHWRPLLDRALGGSVDVELDSAPELLRALVRS